SSTRASAGTCSRRWVVVETRRGPPRDAAPPAVDCDPLAATRARVATESRTRMPGYTARPPSCKIKKALRYVRLYGIRRTLSIVRGQYNMKRTYATPPAIGNTSGPSEKHVGLIG